jgi:transposase InsO family protein
VREIYGDPYVYASRQPILNSLVYDTRAHRFYTEYILPTGEKLPASDVDVTGKPVINYVKRYTEAATWLNMLIRLTTDKAALKRELNIPVMAFWEQATDMIKLKKVNLPANAKRLKEKIKTYQQGGYGSLVEVHKFGNDYSKKVKDEEAEAFLKAFLSHRNKYDDTVIADKYNAWATETGRETITAGAVGYWRKKWASLLMLEREGVAKLYNKVSKQGQRKRPSAPLLLVNSDDNVLDAFFHMGDNKWYRPVLYVVMDAHNDYILGYAVGDNVTKDLIREAYRNAMRHVIKITGDAYCWQQIQTDHWGISGKNTTDLEAFYNSMAIFTAAGLKNSQTKYIERAFGTTWHQQLKEHFVRNYSGHNITAREKLNPDKLMTSDFPDMEQGLKMIDAFIWRMRLTRRKGSELTRHEEWVQNFEASKKSKEHLLTEEQRLQIFGKVHEYTNQISTRGVTPTILGERRVYELSQQMILEHIGKTVQVIYDEHDLSRVLITDGKGLRTVVGEYQLLPSAIADYEEGDKARISNLLEEKKTIVPVIQEWGDAWKAELERGGIDIESRLQAGVLVKEIAHNDQRNYSKKALNSPKTKDSEKAPGRKSFYDQY